MSVEFSDRSAETDDRPSLAAWPLVLAIYLYRIALSQPIAALFGGGCRFHPSCSHYAEGAIRKHGAFRGSMMAIRRLLRCHPWHEGGYDPVR